MANVTWLQDTAISSVQYHGCCPNSKPHYFLPVFLKLLPSHLPSLVPFLAIKGNHPQAQLLLCHTANQKLSMALCFLQKDSQKGRPKTNNRYLEILIPSSSCCHGIGSCGHRIESEHIERAYVSCFQMRAAASSDQTGPYNHYQSFVMHCFETLLCISGSTALAQKTLM